MYKIPVFIPEAVFVFFILLPLFLVIGGYYPDVNTGTFLSMIGLMTGVFWMAGISDYADKVNGKKSSDWFFYLLLLVMSVAALNEIYYNFTDQSLIFNAQFPYPVFSVLADIFASVWLTVKVKKFLKQRSVWFLFLEILFYGFGVATLTPELKDHYRKNKKLFTEEDDTVLK
jgi:hypothetical protein